MYCEECGKEIPDGATFCPHCGLKTKEKKSKSESTVATNQNKDMKIALIISFFLIGLGVAYAGNKKKGILLFVVGLVLGILGIGIPICAVISLLIWVYGLVCTYEEVKIANGASDPNLVRDYKTWDKPKKTKAIVIGLIVLLIVIAGSINAFTLKTTHTDDSDLDSDLDTDLNSDSDSDLDSDDVDTDVSSSSSSDSSSSSSSGSGESYSSSSDGHDVSYHYEGEYGSSDTHGKVYDDGSVESHQKGTTDYGDYQIDSYMDSDGKVHGTVDVGGKTYHVSN